MKLYIFTAPTEPYIWRVFVHMDREAALFGLNLIQQTFQGKNTMIIDPPNLNSGSFLIIN